MFLTFLIVSACLGTPAIRSSSSHLRQASASKISNSPVATGISSVAKPIVDKATNELVYPTFYFMFMFAGTVSTNPWLILIGGIVFMAGTNAGRFGLDYYLMPMLRKLFTPHKKDGATGTKPTAAHA
ncbi:hypothetical protein [Paenibacillus silviterrae]|uniref:hypothetical protein n=1 Tax=Paenibacillus silviterrae TaxID=3242194 RepID=UPI002543C6DA|nr:hypothetical protein [Paenibacillus chinjuensis]